MKLKKNKKISDFSYILVEKYILRAFYDIYDFINKPTLCICRGLRVDAAENVSTSCFLILSVVKVGLVDISKYSL